MMDRRVVVAFLCLFLPIAYTIYVASSLIALIFEDGLKDSVTLSVIEENGNRSDAIHPIPKIIHQTWKNQKIPEQWQIAQFTWYFTSSSWHRLSLYSMDLHPDYHYMVRST